MSRKAQRVSTCPCRHRRVWLAVLVLHGVAGVAQAIVLGAARSRVHEQSRRTGQHVAEIERLRAATIPPWPSTLEALTQRSRELAAESEAQEAAIWGEGGRMAPEGEPAAASEAYFRLQVFRERMVERAAAAGVQLGAENLGFSTYRERGPDSVVMEEVLRQQADLDGILAQVLSAAPRAIGSVQRMRPTAAAAGNDHARIPSEAGAMATDFFEPEPSHVPIVRPGTRRAAYRISGYATLASIAAMMEGFSRPGHTFWIREISLRVATDRPSRFRNEEAPLENPTAAVSEATIDEALEWVLVVQAIDREKSPARAEEAT